MFPKTQKLFTQLERDRIITSVIEILDEQYDNSMTFRSEDYFAIIYQVKKLRKVKND